MILPYPPSSAVDSVFVVKSLWFTQLSHLRKRGTCYDPHAFADIDLKPLPQEILPGSDEVIGPLEVMNVAGSFSPVKVATCPNPPAPKS